MNLPQHWPVIVVGAGPTGLTTANLLAACGIRVLLLERNPSTVAEPRAVSIDDESLRTLQAFGAVDEALSDIVLGYGSDYFSASGRHFLQVKPTSQDFGYPKRNAFRQPVLEAQLAHRLAKQPGAEIWFNAELTDVQQEAGRILLSVRLPGATETHLSCEFLLGCDGARSLVREKIGATMIGSTFRERWLILDLASTVDPSRDTKVFCSPQRPCITLPGPNGTRRYEFMLKEHESDAWATSAATVADLLRLYGSDDPSSIIRTAVYTFHARVADRWSRGRVFLAGDAAHLSPPFAGQGMNSGIRDAHNLAWKIAAVLRGEVGPNILQTYEQERRPHAWQMIQLATRMGHIMMPRSNFSAAALQLAFRVLSIFPPARDYFAQMKYKPKPRFRQGFVSRQPSSPAAAIVGSLFPQPHVSASGRVSLLDDLLGNGFTLITLPTTDPSAFNDLPANFMAAFQPRRVALHLPETSLRVPPGVISATLSSQIFPQSLAKLPGGLLLLRPDRYVAAFVPLYRLDQSCKAIETLFRSTWEPR